METWQTDTIKAAFNKCYGLQEALKNEAIQEPAIESLAYCTGFRIDFIKDNLETIKAMQESAG